MNSRFIIAGIAIVAVILAGFYIMSNIVTTTAPASPINMDVSFDGNRFSFDESLSLVPKQKVDISVNVHPFYLARISDAPPASLWIVFNDSSAFSISNDNWSFFIKNETTTFETEITSLKQGNYKMEIFVKHPYDTAVNWWGDHETFFLSIKENSSTISKYPF